MRWLWWAPLVGFTLFWAVIGVRYGWLAMRTTETDVITRYAETYLREAGAGAALTDCAAKPVEQLVGVWMVITCERNGGSYAYFVNRLGGLEHVERLGTARRWEPEA